MKTITLFIVLLFSVNVYSQGGWEVIQSGESIYGSYFKDAVFFDDQTGWVLTQYNVKKTTNSCQSWITFNISHNGNSMNCFQFLNKETGWVFEGKYVNFTSNGGNNWAVIDTTATGVKGIFFKDLLNGWYCGLNGMVKKTTNGGYNWVGINTGTSNNLNSIAFADTDFGVCGGDWGTIIFTTNGGASWGQFTDIYLGFFTGVKFPNSQICLVTGTGGIIYRTSNRGNNWIPSFTNLPIQNSVEFNSAGTGFIFGAPLSFLKTTNDGAGWDQYSAAGLYTQAFSVSITPSNTFWCAADSGIIFKSTSEGSSWDIAYREYITKENLRSVYFLDQQTGFAAGVRGTLITSTNGGVNWSYRNLGAENSFNSLVFVNGSTGFLGGGQGYFGVVFKTTNRGSNWQIAYRDSAQVNALQFINANTGWGACNNNVFIKTTDAGNSWSRSTIPNASYNNNNDIYFLDQNTGFVGRNGIYKTTDGGLNWYRVLVNSTQTIQFIGNIGYATTTTFMKSTNTGENWVSYPTGGSYRGDVFFINAETGWVNSPSIIRKTTNGGLNWSIQNSNLNSITVNSIFFLNENQGWVVGDYGGIMRTTNGGIGIEPVSSTIPNGYELRQNYPNPFNPTTKLRFSIPLSRGVAEGRGVLLKVYDVLGKEIAVLVNENLKPGTYEIEWDATNIPSGVYFYSLITSEFTQTKKMVVLK